MTEELPEIGLAPFVCRCNRWMVSGQIVDVELRPDGRDGPFLHIGCCERPKGTPHRVAQPREGGNPWSVSHWAPTTQWRGMETR